MSNKTYFVDHEFYKRAYAKIADATDQGEVSELLEELTAYNRINTLSTIYHAKHGWLGASLSIAEIMTALYFYFIEHASDKTEPDIVLLSKGHAAVMQYAALAGLNYFETRKLLDYKQPNGPQAHTDIMTPGITINSGSLGQALSKAFGLGFQCKRYVYVIMGDGELQEGQNFEAFMTLAQYKATNIIPIIDRNGIQSDSNVEDVKGIKDLHAVLAGLGLNVLQIKDGNNIGPVLAGIAKAKEADQPTVIIADTKKGAGISFMASNSSSRRAYSWHGGIPLNGEYAAALHELAAHIQNDALKQHLWAFCSTILSEEHIDTVKKHRNTSTGTAFSNLLPELAEKNTSLIVLDADLEKSCHLTPFAEAFPERYLEMGIAEQDMVSVAGGLALNGKCPVVNTYGSFYRRAFEQIYVNATEKTKIIYAGHYSGLCYTTDGKTHQCTGDVAMMRSLPGMIVLYPAFNSEISQMLTWFQEKIKDKPVYFRLHRTPFLAEFNQPESVKFVYGYGIPVVHDCRQNCIITSGPQMTAFCANAARKHKHDLYALSSLDYAAPEFLLKLATQYSSIYVIEELIYAGGLFDLLCQGFASLIAAGKIETIPKIRHKAVDDFTISDRKATGLYRKFQLTPETLF